MHRNIASRSKAVSHADQQQKKAIRRPTCCPYDNYYRYDLVVDLQRHASYIHHPSFSRQGTQIHPKALIHLAPRLQEEEEEEEAVSSFLDEK